MASYSHLQYWERKVIKKMLTDGCSFREIGRFLNRHPGTIKREVENNSGRFWYRPSDAQRKYEERRKNSKSCILDTNDEIRAHVIDCLKKKQSPDAIAGRLKMLNKKCPDKWVSHETIYSWIYKKAREGSKLYKQLARSARTRQKRQNKYKKRIPIPNRVSIHKRPQSVENRKTIGHWEGDTIIGKGHKGAIATLVERKTYFLAAGLMENRKSSTCYKALLEATGDILNSRFKSMTFDNGYEFYNHEGLKEAFECKTYFADPYCSWQRARNEHTNGLLRKFFPKGSSFEDLTQNDVDDAVRVLNNTPRKSLGYRTPYEVFYNLPVAPQT